MKKIDIEKYIEDYENRKITVEEIANKENLNPSTIYRKLNEYYKQKGRTRPKMPTGAKRKKIDIEKYIEDYENRKITLEEIAGKEKVNRQTIRERINKYYEKNGKIKPKIFSGRIKKQIKIEKYVKDYENGEIKTNEISEKEHVTYATIRTRINEYYKKSGKEKTKLSIKAGKRIEQYIGKYENGDITIEEIAQKTNLSTSTIERKINEYYKKNGKEKPKVSLIRIKKQLDIEKYIEDYERKKITIPQIAKIENVSYNIIKTLMRDYYESIRGNNVQKDKQLANGNRIIRPISKSIRTTIKDFIKRGLTKEEIVESAKKRNVIISDELFEELLKEIQEERKGEER